MIPNSDAVDRRTVLKGLGAAGVLGAGGIAFTGGGAAQMSSTFDAEAVTVSADTGDVDEITLAPNSRIEWDNFDVPVTKVRQLLMARLKQDGSIITPTDPATPQTENGWWPIYRETPWLFETVGGSGATLPVGNGCGSLNADAESITYETPAGSLSADQSPTNPNHAEVFISDGDANWDMQIRYATGDNQSVPVMEGWSYQTNGGQWQSGTPQGYSASRNGDTITISTPGHSHVGAATTTVDANAGSDTCYVAAPGATKPWDTDGLISVDEPDFLYNGQPAEYHKWGYMNELKLRGAPGQKTAATSGVLDYDLLPSSGPNAGSGPIYVVKENTGLPTYQQSELTGVSLGQTPPHINGSYGTVGTTSQMDNPDDGSNKTTQVELGLLTTAHTDYDFAEAVAVPSDSNPDRLSPLAMGNSPDVDYQFGSDTHAIPYAELIANHGDHPAVEWITTSFTVTAHNEPTQNGSQTTANTGGS